jgi:hypothetical protein
MGTRPDFSPFVSKRDGLNLRLIGNRGEIMAAALFNRHALIGPGRPECVGLQATKDR